MNYRFELFNSLKFRLIASILLPTLLIAVFILFYFIRVRINDLENNLDERGRSISYQFIAWGGYSVWANDTNSMRELGNTLLQEPEVKSVAFYDIRGKKLVHVGPAQQQVLAEKNTKVTDKYGSIYIRSKSNLTILVPIKRDASRFINSLNRDENEVGWMLLTLYTTELRLKQYEFVMIIMTIFISILFVVVFYAFNLARYVTDPFYCINVLLQQIAEGNYKSKLHIKGPSELIELKNNINYLILQASRREKNYIAKLQKSSLELTKLNILLDKQKNHISSIEDKLEIADHLQSNFLANMSHEIRTPLNGILGFINLLNKTNLDPRQKDYISTVMQSSDHLLSVVNNILDFSKLEAGKLVLDKLKFSLRDLVEEVVYLFTARALEKNIDVVLDIYPDVPSIIEGDPIRLRQVFNNLISNAIKFTKSGLVKVIIKVSKLKVENATDKKLLIIVEDTGIGISTNEQKNIFKAFGQADTSIARKFGGTGLGLVICKKLINIMSGEINLKSSKNMGAKFYVNLPLTNIEQSKCYALEGVKILLFDNCPDISKSIMHLLQSMGAVVSILSFNEKIDSTFLQNYDLVFLGITIENCDNALKFINCNDISIIAYIIGLSSTLISKISENNIKYVESPVRYHQYLTVIKSILANKKNKPSINDQINENFNLLTRPLKAIVVDDYSPNAKLLDYILSQYNIEVMTALNGNDAINIFNSYMPDIVFLDICMPDIDGRSLLKILKKNNTFKKVLFCAVSAHMFDSQQNLIDMGFDAFLAKPVNLDDLKVLLERLFKSIFSQNSTFKIEEEVDASLLKKRFGKHLSSLRKVYIDFFDDVTKESKRILYLLDVKDKKNILFKTHKLLGASGYLGLLKLKKSILKIDEALKNNDWNDASFAASLLKEHADLLEKKKLEILTFLGIKEIIDAKC